MAQEVGHKKRNIIIIIAVVATLLVIAAILVGTIPFPVVCQDLSIENVEPSQTVCLAQSTVPITLVGSGFMQIDGSGTGDIPVVTFDNNPIAVDSMNSTLCDSVYSKGHNVKNCKALSITLPNEGEASQTRQASIVVKNNSPCGSHTSATTSMYIFGAPAVTEMQPAVCVPGNNGSRPVNLTIFGSNFAWIGADMPIITMQQWIGNAWVPLNFTLNALDGCTTPFSGAQEAQACSMINVTVWSTGYTTNVSVSVTNNHEFGCSTTFVTQPFLPPPNATYVVPSEICSDQSTEVAIYGLGLSASSTITFVKGTQQVTFYNVTYVSANQVNVTVAPSQLPSGIWSLTLATGSCVTATPVKLAVDPIVVVFFLDPPVVYGGVQTGGIVYTSGLLRNGSTVSLIGPAPSAAVIPIASVPEQTSVNRLDVTIPQLAAGNYSVQVTSDIGCTNTLDNGLTVVSQLTVPILNVAPSYLYTNDTVAVRINGPAVLNYTAGQRPFEATPRVLISPQVGNALAVSIRALVWVNNNTLNGVVRAGLPPGKYDLVVINPDESVGFLKNAITIVPSPTPVIYSVTPDTYTSEGTGVISGANFYNTSQFSLSCLASGSTTPTTINITTQTFVSSTTVNAIFPISANTQGVGTVCTVTVTNPDQSFFVFSAVATRSSSGNLIAVWPTRTSFNDPRRGHVMFTGNPTLTSRYMYIVGGDNGTASGGGVKLTTEAATVDVYGNLGTWSFLPASNLPVPRTFAQPVVVGRFAYIVAGRDGTGATGTLLRAQVLDPLNTPQIDVTLDILQNATALTSGLYYYVVSATFDPSDTVNPNGESLPGELLSLQLPRLSNMQLTLQWNAINRATGYRIYRSPSPNLPPSSVTLLATTSGNTNTVYVDIGGSTTPGQYPLPQGSLGKWSTALPRLNTPREGHASVVVVDPSNANSFYIYALGGRDATGTVLTSVEWIHGTEAGDDQTFGTWNTANNVLPFAKADFRGVVMTTTDISAIPTNQAWIYLGSGSGPAVPSTGNFEGFSVNFLNGSLVNMTTGGSKTMVGYCMFKAFNDLYITGLGSTAGLNGAVSWPTISTFSADPSNLSEAKQYAGCAQESVFFYISGGESSYGVSNVTDYNVM